MHSALSVIFFTTLSGAGYGLMAWLGLSLFMLHTRADLMPMLQPMYLWGLLAGLMLSTAGLLSSLAHLGRPARAWRALGQWRTSWLSREGVLALLFWLMALLLPTAPPETGSLLTLALLGTLLAGCKLAYWRDIDRQPLPATRGAALGLPGREASVFERPHTEASFITREMVFVLARRHARSLRAATLALLAGVPLAAWALAAGGVLSPAVLLAPAALALLAGAYAERWLFFAQARHLVSLYY